MPPKFGKVNQDKIREDFLGLGSGMFRIPSGVTTFKLLPPHGDSKNGVWYRSVRRHSMFFGEGRLNASITCPEDDCPICDLGDQIYSEGGEAVKFAENLRPRTQFFVNAMIYTSAGDFEFGRPYIMQVPNRMFKSILTCEKDTADDWSDVTGINEYQTSGKLLGVTFKVTKSGQGLKTTYELTPMSKRTDLLEDLRTRGVNPESFDFLNLENVEWMNVPKPEVLNELVEKIKKERAVQTRGGFVGASTASSAVKTPFAGTAETGARTVEMPDLPLPPDAE